MFEPFLAGKSYRLRHGDVWADLIISPELLEEVEPGAMEQLRNVMELPGVTGVTATPDLHFGYGFPIGCTAESATHLYPDAVGVDPSCSVGISRLHTDLAAMNKPDKRGILNKIAKLVGVGNEYRDTGMDTVKLSQIINGDLRPGGAWINAYPRIDITGTTYKRFVSLLDTILKPNMLKQFLTIGGGNHTLAIEFDQTGTSWLITHFGSRGLGAALAKWFDKAIREEMAKWGGAPHKGLIFLPAESDLGQLYLMFNMAMLEVATYNHHLIHSSVASLLGEKLKDFGHVPHNFIEQRDGRYIGRKGTIPNYDNNGIPLVVLGNMTHGSAFFAPGEKYNSIAHGAGRRFSRTQANRSLDQQRMTKEFHDAGAVGNFRNVPLDEAHDAYKDFDQVLTSLISSDAAVLTHRTTPALVLKGG